MLNDLNAAPRGPRKCGRQRFVARNRL